jgi:phosphonate transport system permease protein
MHSTKSNRPWFKQLLGSTPLLWVMGSTIVLAMTLIPTGIFQRSVINFNGWPQLWRFLGASLQPNLSGDLLRITGEATIITLAYAFCGTALTVLIGAVLGVLCSEIWWQSVLGQRGRWVYWPLRLLLAIPRAIHELIWGLFFVNIWGLDPCSAIAAIAIPFGAITAKVFAEILDDTPRQPLTALLNSGVAPIPAFFYSLFPQALPNLLSYIFYRFECSLRSAAVLGIIGAGGLGYQILISLQSLKYQELWTFFYTLILLNGLVDWTSAQARQRIAQPRSPKNTLVRLPQHWGLGGGLIATIASFLYLQPNYNKLWSARSQKLLQEFLTGMMPPDWTVGQQLWEPTIETLAMSVVAMFLAAFGGLFLAFLAARNFTRSTIGLSAIGLSAIGLSAIGFGLSRFILLVSRAIPAPIWALVILYVMFPGILPGAIALGLHNLGILGRLMAEVIENLDRRPLEALQTTGATKVGVFLYGVLPLTIPQFLAYSLYRWEVCLRETVIVGLVGAGGLGRLLTEQLTSFDYRSLIVTLIAFLVLTFGVDGLSGVLRRSLR